MFAKIFTLFRYIAYATIIGTIILMISISDWWTGDIYYEISKHEPSIFMVFTDVAGGTAFAVKDSDGKNVLITNAHVCNSALPLSYVKIFQNMKNTTHISDIVKISSTYDLCILSVPINLNVVPFDIADKWYPYQQITTYGYPRSFPMMKNSGHILSIRSSTVDIYSTKGICYLPYKPIITYTGSMCTLPMIVLSTTLQIDGGASGSPVLNSSSEVVGVVSTMIGIQGWAQAIPFFLLTDFLKETTNK